MIVGKVEVGGMLLLALVLYVLMLAAAVLFTYTLYIKIT